MDSMCLQGKAPQLQYQQGTNATSHKARKCLASRKISRGAVVGELRPLWAVLDA